VSVTPTEEQKQLAAQRLANIREQIVNSNLDGEDLARLESDIGIGFRQWLIGTRQGREGMLDLVRNMRVEDDDESKMAD